MGTNDFLEVLPEMVAFLRVAELGSFSAAARQLGMTPSAVSRRVKRLERVLRVQLMFRTTRQLRLTEPGLEAFARCSDLVRAAQETMQVADQYASSPRGTVRISAPKAFARHVLHPVISKFLEEFPEIDIQLLVVDRDVDPIRDGIDLVIRLTHEPPLGLAARRLMPVQPILCATSHYLNKTPKIEHPHDLVNHSCLYLGEKERDNRWFFKRGKETAEVVVHGRYVANHSELRLGGVLADLGIGCIPHFVAHETLASGAAERVLADWDFQAAYAGHAYILYPQTRFSIPKMRAVIDYLVEHIDASWQRF
ncbi:LysR family transcriptional regulator [Salinisphaera sp. SWV1]|uniref:LysR family transcriptional regulator n=1 Tax=Salinisphaera sp. SWV1 TaxID=3454139 RepID=UPI003F870747